MKIEEYVIEAKTRKLSGDWYCEPAMRSYDYYGDDYFLKFLDYTEFFNQDKVTQKTTEKTTKNQVTIE